jgi:hypothetical protein
MMFNMDDDFIGSATLYGDKNAIHKARQQYSLTI